MSKSNLHPGFTRLCLWLILILAAFGAGLVWQQTKASASAAGAAAQPKQNITAAGPIDNKEDAEAWAKQLPFVPKDAEMLKTTWDDVDSKPVWIVESYKTTQGVSNEYRDYATVMFTRVEGRLTYVGVEHQVISPMEETVGGENSVPEDERKLPLEEGIRIAQSFIDNLEWGLDAEWTPDPYPEPLLDIRFEDPRLRKIRFYRVVNGARYDDCQFTVYLDSSGNITSYNVEWRDFGNPVPVTEWSLEEAQEAVVNQFVPSLVYENEGDLGPRLVYTSNGGRADFHEGAWRYQGENLQATGKERRVSEKELEALQVGSDWTVEKLTARIKAALELQESIRMLESNRSEGRYEFSVPSDAPDSSRTDYITVSTRTGQFEFYRVVDEAYSEERKGVRVSEEEARDEAYKFLQRIVPAYSHELSELLVSTNDSGGLWGLTPQFVFIFYRTPGGIPLQGESLGVWVNAHTGKVDQMESHLTETRLPQEAIPAISYPKARNMLLSLYNLELRYGLVDVGKTGLYYELRLRPDIPMFVNGASPRLDAYTGEWRDLLGKNITDQVPQSDSWVDELMSSPGRVPYEAAIVLDGKLINIQQEPQIWNDVTMVPMRMLFESLGAEVSWDAETRTVLAVKRDMRLELPIGSPTMKLNGETHPVTMPAQIVQDSTYVPARLVAEALGAQVDWDGGSRLVIVRTSPDLPYPNANTLKRLRLEAYLNWEEKYR